MVTSENARLEEQFSVGRGPVVPSAVYPLLARGMLGNHAELQMFDPLTLARREIVYRIVGRESLALRDGQQVALKVDQEIGDLHMTVWLDDRGAVLREQLPLGLKMELESRD